ncbi:MAG: transcription elongation factor GreA [Proteobacteria bacterium]|nr:MAG: transcription elongation factor GreA [Pseudomonadota bacterium]
MSKSPMTLLGVQRLREELHTLKTVDRPRIIAAIAEARAHGDLKENAEYHAAREQQSFAEGRIAEIDGKLSNAEIIDVTKIDAGGKVIFGATIDLLNLATEEQVSYKIVGEDEADIKAGMVSVGSPVARSLIGKRSGDEVNVQAPGGLIEYEILDVRYL